MALITAEARKELIAIHVAMFKAAPSADRLSAMVQQVEAGKTPFQVAAAAAADPDYGFGQVYPGLLTGEEFANSLADTLLAAGTPAGARDWAIDWATAQLSAGVSRSDIIVAAIQALNINTNPDFDSAELKVRNLTDVAEYYSVTKLQNSDSLQDLQDVLLGVTEEAATVTAAKTVIDGDAATATGKTFTLTIGENSGAAFTGTSGNDIFEAPVTQNNVSDPVDTLESFDALNGGDGTDTLRATFHDAQAGVPAPVLKSIENIEARFTGATQELSLANASGVTSVVFSASTVGDGVVSDVGKIATLGVQNQKGNATFTDNTATTLGLKFATAGDTAPGGAASLVTLADVVTTLNVTTSASNTKIAGLTTVETLTVDATGSNTFHPDTTAASIKVATITGAGTVNLGATGKTAVTLSELTTLTATASGGVSAKVDDTAVTVTTGAGKDSITYTAGLAATAVVNLGAGNDTFGVGGKALAGASVDAGTGTDTLNVPVGGNLDADAADVYKNFETLGINGGTGIYDMENLPGLTAVFASAALTAGVDIQNAEEGTKVTISSVPGGTDVTTGFGITFGLADDSATDDSVTLTLGGADSATTKDGTAGGNIIVTGFVADGIETFDVISNISNIDPLLELADYANQIVALEGDAVTLLKVSGTGNLAVGGVTAAVLAKVDASGLTGGLEIDVSGNAQSIEFLGGAGDDIYTATPGGDTINAGKGADEINLDASGETDTLIFAAGDSVMNTDLDGNDEINGFEVAADQIDLGAFSFASGSQTSALANKGALAASVTDGSTLTQADFFLSGGSDRAVAIGTTNAGADTVVFVDVNKNGDFDAASDLVFVLIGTVGLSNANFGY